MVSAQIPALPHADTCAGRCRYLRRPMQVPAFLGAVSYVFQTVNLHLLVESARYKVSTNPPNRTIWFVDAPLWFADAVFFIYKHPTSVKTTSISALFPQNPCTIQINALPLQHENPPSLSTMLKCAGRFFYMYLWQSRQYSIKLISHQKSQ